MGNIRKLGAFVAFVFTLVAVSAAVPTLAGAAPVASVFDGKIPCTVQPSGVRYCNGAGGAVANTVNSFDGSPIDVNFALPDETEFGPGPYPLAMYFHGFGGSKEGFNGDLKRFTDMGIAAMSMTDRGFSDSCGKAAAIAALELAGENCTNGFVHLMDTRYEVRDAQWLAGMLVDDGVVIPNKIGSVGASYGGTKSIALAALKNRVMLPDGSLAPWTSPDGAPMELAASAPIVPPSDFAAALVPNGRTLEYMLDAPYGNTFGVMKIGIISALIGGADNFSGDNGPVQSTWDIKGWKAMMEAGEPYGAGPLAQFMVDEMTTHHSAYYIDDSIEPAPLLIAEGLTDDLFPINEALRYYNRTKSTWPDAEMSLLFADIGHPRAPLTGEFEQGRPADKELGFQRVESWFAYYLKGEGTKPVNGVEARSQTCPYEEPSGGPFTGPNWAAMSPGELRLTDPTVRMIEPDAGIDSVATNFSILNNACTQKPVTAEPGTVTYSFGTVPAGGYTLMGAPTVISKMSVANGSESQVAARLWEISDRKQRLIGRGIYRPDRSGAQVFQLNGNVYEFEPGTEIQLQLLPKDGVRLAPIASSFRPSNDQKAIRISDVDIRLPLAEAPGTRRGVKKPLPKVLPRGAKLALDYRSSGAISLFGWSGHPTVKGAMTVRGRSVRARVACPIFGASCGPNAVAIRRGGQRGFRIAAGRGIRVPAGRSRTVSLKLTGAGRRLLKRRGRSGLRAVWTTYGGGLRRSGLATLRPVGRIR